MAREKPPIREEMAAWRGAGRLVATASSFNANLSLHRFTQAPPVEYAALSQVGTEECRRHFDPAAFWMWAVAVNAYRQGEAISQADLIRRSGFTKSTGRRLLHQLNHAGFIILRPRQGRTQPAELILHLPSRVSADWRLTQQHRIECLGLEAATYLTSSERTAEEIAVILEAEERAAELDAAARRSAAAEARRIGSPIRIPESQDGSRARPPTDTLLPVGEEQETRRDKRDPLEERYFPTRCPDWGDPGWFRNLCRRVGKEDALSAIGQVNFQIDLGGENAPRSPRGLATWLGSYYANKTGNGGGPEERRRHEARRREAVEATKRMSERETLAEAGQVLMQMGLDFTETNEEDDGWLEAT